MTIKSCRMPISAPLSAKLLILTKSTVRSFKAFPNGMPTTAESEAKRPPIPTEGGQRFRVHKLRANVSVLEGSGGNIAVRTGADGKVFIDAGIAVSRSRI